MSATYGSELTQDKDRVRFLIRDTDTTNAIFQDAELVWLVGQEQNVYMAAYQAALIAVTKTARSGSRKIGNLSIDEPGEFYKGLAVRLKARGSGHQEAFVGGISIDDKDVLRDDDDWIDPSFATKQFDTPGLQPTKPSDLEEID